MTALIARMAGLIYEQKEVTIEHERLAVDQIAL
jgi:hypothetical protein